MSEFIDEHCRNELENINILSGLSEMIYAFSKNLNHSLHSGGIPQIKILKEGDIYEPSENNCLMAKEIEFAYRKNFLNDGKVRSQLIEDSLMNKDANFLDIENILKENCSDWDSFCRMQRGYKI